MTVVIIITVYSYYKYAALHKSKTSNVKAQCNQLLAMKCGLQQAAFEFISGYAMATLSVYRGRSTISVNNTFVTRYSKK